MIAPVQGSPLAAPAGRSQHRTPRPRPSTGGDGAGPAPPSSFTTMLTTSGSRRRPAGPTSGSFLVSEPPAGFDLSGTVVVPAGLARDPTRQRV